MWKPRNRSQAKPEAALPAEAASPTLQSVAAQRRPSRSLKMRAVDYLSRRDHSRVELQRKLAPHAQSPEQVAAVINDLEIQGFFNEARFVSSFSRRRGEKYGVARVTQELAAHRLSSDQTAAVFAQLKATETNRAQSVWQRRFNHLPQSLEERGKQQRFLQQRGFSSAAIQAVLKGRVTAEFEENLAGDND